jgi:hypothetical protein
MLYLLTTRRGRSHDKSRNAQPFQRLCDIKKIRGSLSRAPAGGGLGKPGICPSPPGILGEKKIEIEKKGKISNTDTQN